MIPHLCPVCYRMVAAVQIVRSPRGTLGCTVCRSKYKKEAN